MERVTTAKINKALKETGLNVEVVKGNGYFYFAGGDAHKWYSTMVYTTRLNDMPVEKWVEEAKALSKDIRF